MKRVLKIKIKTILDDGVEVKYFETEDGESFTDWIKNMSIKSDTFKVLINCCDSIEIEHTNFPF